MKEVNSLQQPVADQIAIGAEYSSAFLQLKTGEILRLQDVHLEEGGLAGLSIEELTMLPTLPSEEIYLWMEDFVPTVKETLKSLPLPIPNSFACLTPG